MAALQAVSDPASLDGGLAGSDREVPVSSGSAKQRHRRWKASLKISSRCLACASAESSEYVGMRSYRKWGEKSWAKAGKSLPFVCHLSSFT